MFRNPRANTVADVGRPPTPPSERKNNSTSATVTPMTETKPTPALPRIGRQPGPKPSPAKGKAGGNGSILNFFKKAEPPAPVSATALDTDENLFVSDDEAVQSPIKSLEAVTTIASRPVESSTRDQDGRFNEARGPIKRQRLNDSPIGEERPGEHDSAAEPAKRSILQELNVTSPQSGSPFTPVKIKEEPQAQSSLSGSEASCPIPPPLKREPTSAFDDNFDGIEDFADDEFPPEGEETMERRFMEEQRLMELEFESDYDEPANRKRPSQISTPKQEDQASPECPVCGRILKGYDDAKASLHVNDCLDGKVPDIEDPSGNTHTNIVEETPEDREKPKFKRFQRAAIARPGQANPFNLDAGKTGASAFSKIMASHAEDTAWATAAANELAARGKPAFKRTCPFYKILPGFFTCVDAFRYGAVEGCHAYFLSHFHSDHYIGLTSSWCHGPIYCSRVTGNLVRQQLRVDPKWVVDLEWEVKTEIPRTEGVYVTMIPANHCPGSSLFLFEKEISRGTSTKLQRVLHCGDFRACVAHVQHPLLRPEVADIVTGKKRQQKLDVCYLDTTYLTPKYAFPRQEEVIQACADMCVSLSKDKPDLNDSWEKMKKQRAGSGMTKFIGKAEDTEQNDDETKVSSTADETKSRGRLLVIVGTYSIGKERICLGVAKALNSKIFAPPGKLRICSALEDPELSARLTGNPLEAQVHMQMLMEIRAETLADYLTSYRPHFSRIVGFRPSGWNYRPPNSRFVESPAVQTVLHSDSWRPSYSMAELTPQRGSTREASCFGVPYSEHSSFRELTMFCCALHIDKIIPTVNVGSAKSRDKMKTWIERWNQEKRKNGLFKVADDVTAW